MTAFLLDVNVLIALAWKGHPDHRVAQDWFARNNKAGWATCPFTEAAFRPNHLEPSVFSGSCFATRSLEPADCQPRGMPSGILASDWWGTSKSRMPIS
jgi:hypothetical protein